MKIIKLLVMVLFSTDKLNCIKVTVMTLKGVVHSKIKFCPPSLVENLFDFLSFIVLNYCCCFFIL